MHTFKIVTAAAILTLLYGCIPSLHPLYTEEDLVFEPGLVGKWTDNDSRETWEFRKAGDKAYTMLSIMKDGEKEKIRRFDAHLLKVDGKMFLDLYPTENPTGDDDDPYAIYFVPAHIFYQVGKIEPVLSLRLMNPEWLSKFLEENPQAIKYEEVEDRIVLTDEPKKMQEFFVKHLKTDGAYTEFSDLKRVKPEEPKKESTEGEKPSES